MKINIKGKEIELRITMRGLMIYENLIQNTKTPENTMTSVVLYFYAVVMGSCKNFDLDFDEFVDYLDDNENLFNEFVEFLNKTNKVQNNLSPIKADKKPVKKKMKE